MPTSLEKVTVKICGLTSAEAADAAARAGAEYGGLVFHPASPRNLTLAQARTLSAAMRGRLKRVALVADPTDAELAAIVAAAEPEFLQLHGNESVARTAGIRARFGKPVIKALPVSDSDSLKVAADYAAVADMLLFDAQAPREALRAGGHGVAFDWTVLAGQSFSKPWFLAGGLNPENVAAAIRASGTTMVDVSSGVEKFGVKDGSRIGQFMMAVRAARAANDTVQA
jgi:phosphoribosylanthranilate isomerase